MNGEQHLMIPTKKEPWKAFISSMLVLSLTACSTGRSQYAWHDLGAHQAMEVAKVSPPSERWGRDAQAANVSDPVIAPGYLLTARSADDAKLNGDFRVEFDGNLVLPYDVTVNASGMTVSQLEKRLGELYKPYFKTTSGVKLSVRERRYWVDVRGLVEKPGRYLVEQNTSLDQLIGMAGGLERDSMPRFVRVQKGPKSLVLDLHQYLNKADDRPQIAAWMGGETVGFQKDIVTATSTGQYQLPVYIMGEVRKPGEYPIKAGTDFVDLVTRAEGFTTTADLSRIEVIRRTGNKQLDYEFSWNNFHRAPTLMEGDVVFVHANSETRRERHLSVTASILSALASIITAVVIVDRL
jgi:protein involved in polysaccharide export with SLBB domain